MIHETAIVSDKAIIGDNVSIGPHSIIYGNVEIGANSTIGAFCEIGHPTPRAEGRPLRIGSDANIRSYSLFYEGSVFGPKLVTGHRVTVREGTAAGVNLQIGTLSDIQGSCEIGDYVRFHSNVHIGQKSKIDNFVWIFPYVVLTNDPHPPSDLLIGCVLEEFSVVATMSIVLPGVTVGRGALVGAHSSVNRDVEPGMVVAGSPAKPICRADKIKLKDGTDRVAYPWINHFSRGYPEEVVARWREQPS